MKVKSEKSLTKIEGDLKEYFKQKNIQGVEFKIEGNYEQLRVRKNLEPILILRSLGKQVGAKQVIGEEIAPASNGFELNIWFGNRMYQAIAYQRSERPAKHYDLSKKTAYYVYSGVVPNPENKEREILYRLAYGTDIKQEFIQDIKKIIAN